MKIEEIADYLSQLDTHMSNVAKGTTQLVKRNRDLANALFEFGQAFTWLGQSEGDALGTALVQVGNAADQLSVISTEFSETESLRFEEPIQEYCRLIASVRAAIGRRQEKRSNYAYAVGDLESRQASYTKALSAPGKEVNIILTINVYNQKLRFLDFPNLNGTGKCSKKAERARECTGKCREFQEGA